MNSLNSYILGIIILFPFNACTPSMKNTIAQDCYSTISIQESLEILKKNSIDHILTPASYSQPHNGLRGYHLKDDQFLFIPGRLNKKYYGILVRDRICFEKIIQAEFSMFENPDDRKSPLEAYQSEIKSVQRDRRTAIQSLLRDEAIDLRNISLKNIEKLYNQISAGKANPSFPRKAIGFMILFGLYHNYESNSRWVLWKHYGSYSPYYEPVILDSNGQVSTIYDKLLSCLTGNVEFRAFYKLFLNFTYQQEDVQDVLIYLGDE
ncbi:MAG: hypothetical protein AAFP89_17370 [Bacteroidota bacterium]